MFNYLNKLRQKPKKEKQKIALVTSAVITFCIAVVWWISSPPVFSPQNTETATTTELSPVKAIQDSVGEMFDGIKKQYSDLSNVIGTPPPVVTTEPVATTSVQ